MSDRSSQLRSTEERLQDEVRELRRELRRLQVRVDRQEDEISSLSASFSAVSIGGDRSSVGSREVTEAPLSPVRTEEAAPSEAAGAAAAGGTVEPPGPVSWTFREAVARDIGLWLRRALNGEHRGNSGRERVALSSRYYLVLRDLQGRVYQDPVLVFNRFTPVKRLCQEGRNWGDSIFIGAPTIREGQIAALAAGLTWPNQIQ